jgi:hypothetical protein
MGGMAVVEMVVVELGCGGARRGSRQRRINALEGFGGFLVGDDRGGQRAVGGPTGGGGAMRWHNGKDATATTGGRRAVVRVRGAELVEDVVARERHGHEDTRPWSGSKVADKDMRRRRT